MDITPPLGIEMGGFHRTPGNERRITGIRQPTAARALVLQYGNTRAAIVSLDIACLAEEVAVRIQRQVAKERRDPGGERANLLYAHPFDARLLLSATVGSHSRAVHGLGREAHRRSGPTCQR